MGFGRFLEGFWMGFGRILEGFWENFCEGFGRMGMPKTTFGQTNFMCPNCLFTAFVCELLGLVCHVLRIFEKVLGGCWEVGYSRAKTAV